MCRNRVEDFGPYQDALKLFDHVVADMDVLRKDSRCYRLIGQQMGSADSICANIDEGFGRLSRTELIRFLDISRGSARETLGRYKRLKHWLPKETIAARVEIADRIVARLTKSINTLRANNDTRHPKRSSQVREARASYQTTTEVASDMILDEDIDELLRIVEGNTRHPEASSGIKLPTRDTRHPTPDTRHATPDTRHATPDTRHPTPDC